MAFLRGTPFLACFESSPSGMSAFAKRHCRAVERLGAQLPARLAGGSKHRSPVPDSTRGRLERAVAGQLQPLVSWRGESLGAQYAENTLYIRIFGVAGSVLLDVAKELDDLFAVTEIFVRDSSNHERGKPVGSGFHLPTA